MRQAGLAGYSGEANFLFATSQAGDNLLVAAGSTAKDSTYVFTVDPLVVVPETGKIFCDWQVSGKTNTMFSFWNGGNTPEDAELLLFFPGGHYRLPVHLAANESRTVDLASLVHSGIPDQDGNVFPSYLVEGSARLTNPHGRMTPMDIHAHGAIFNVETATCMEPCPQCDSIIAVHAAPPDAVVGVGGTAGYTSTVTTKTGGSWDVTSSTQWSSQATGIATIATNALATGVAAGSATITGTYYGESAPSWSIGSMCRYPLPACPLFVGRPSQPIKVRIPFASQYVQTAPGYPKPNSRCPSGQIGLDREIFLDIIDQTFTPYTVNNVSVTEQITITLNQLSPDSSVLTGQENTYSGVVEGQYDDEYYFCSTLCNVSTGEIDATQNITYGGTSVVSPNKIVLKCSSITFNNY